MFALLLALQVTVPQQLDTLLVLGREIPSVTVTPPEVNLEVTVVQDMEMIAAFQASMDALTARLEAFNQEEESGPWYSDYDVWWKTATVGLLALAVYRQWNPKDHSHPLEEHDHPHEHELPPHEHEYPPLDDTDGHGKKGKGRGHDPGGE